MATKFTGGCQCGNIRYEVVGTPKQLVVCHCTDCQRQSGSAFGPGFSRWLLLVADDGSTSERSKANSEQHPIQ